jgi:hypothetical protein
MDALDLLVAFSSALLGAVAGSWTTVWLGAKQERADVSDRILFDVYLRLLELNALYFWITTADFHRNERNSDVIQRVEALARSVADDLRRVRDRKAVVDIFDVLASRDSRKYPDSATRYKRLQQLLSVFGRRFSPEYIEAASQIGASHFQALVEDTQAPEQRMQIQNAPLFISE